MSTNQAISFPYILGPDGTATTTTSPTKIYLDRVVTLLSTNVGQLPISVTYGVDWSKSLFEADGDAQVAIKQAIADAIAQWIPEVEVLDVNIDYDPGSGIENVVLSLNLPGNVSANLPINSALLNYDGTIVR